MINPTKVRKIMTKRTLALVAGLALATACKDATTVPDLNNVSSSLLSTGLNRASVQLLVTGLLNQDRGNWGETYIVFTESMARDLYRIDPAENRWITQTIGGLPDPSSFVGGGLWGGYWTAIKALAYWQVLEARDTVGLPIAVDQPFGTPPAPFVCKEDALAYVSALLDSAYNSLLAAGATPFPLTLPAGFTQAGNYSTPTAFAAWNRGWKGKIEYYRGIDHQKPNAGSYTTAIAALTQALGTLSAATLENSPYYTYSTAPGAGENPFGGDIAVHLNPSAGNGIQAG